jgi:hypothetical protein
VKSNSLRDAQRTEKKVTTITDDCNQVLTVPELAYRLRVAPSWVYAHAEVLGAYRLGKYLRFDWNRVLDRLSAGPIEKADVGVAAQRPSREPMNAEGCGARGTRREQKRLDI